VLFCVMIDERAWVMLRNAIVFPFLLLLLFFGSGCSTTSEAVVRPQFATYDRVAILPHLTRAQEEYFLPLYLAAFPEHAVVERRDLEEALNEQELQPERLSEASRAKMKELFGVQAVVYPNYTSDEAGTRLALKVIDSETGEITAAILVRKRSGALATDTTDFAIIRKAIDLLRSELGDRSTYLKP